MEPSEEIRDAMHEVLTAFNDDEATWRRIWSARPGALSIGTDPREWWESGDAAASLHAKQTEERGPAYLTVRKLMAVQEGSVGWAAADTEVDWRGGHTDFRATAIFHLERGKWKLVHFHRSFGIPNESYGAYLTTSVETIAETVAEERIDMSHATAPNGTVTILFTDIEGSTQLLERLGEAAWMDVLHGHNRAVRDHATRNSGFEVKSQGDGFMLAFASARNALRCAVGIQRELAANEGGGVLVRIGLHTAEAIREADDFYGRGVVLAARVAAEARGTEILVSSLVRELVETSGEFDFEDPVEVELKGLRGLHRLSAVRWRSN